MLVQDGVHDEFLDMLAKAAEGLETGNEDESKNYFGPLNNINHFNSVRSVLDSVPDHAECRWFRV